MLPRRTGALHAHRWSEPAAIYFVTCCTRNRAPGLTGAAIAGALRETVQGLDADGDTDTHAFTVMPDHVHWLLALGDRLSLGRIVVRLKTQTKATLETRGFAWQRDFFEHRLRADEAVEPYGLYIFLNPYRARLLSPAESWPHWWCPQPGHFRFMTLLRDGQTPPSDWIGEPVPDGLPVGE
ncbi:MAG TPA: transposase [Opitutaceae bacterium]|nr:transposase [Opitutaceae bacterium]